MHDVRLEACDLLCNPGPPFKRIYGGGGSPQLGNRPVYFIVCRLNELYCMTTFGQNRLLSLDADVFSTSKLISVV